MKNYKIALFIPTLFIAVAGDSVTVSEFYATIRVSPYGDANRMGIAKKGDVLKVLSQEGGWYRIEYNHAPAWINEHYVVPTLTYTHSAPVQGLAAPETASASKNVQTVSKPAAQVASEPMQPIIRKMATTAAPHPKNASGKNQPKPGKSTVAEKKPISPAVGRAEEAAQTASPKPAAAAQAAPVGDKTEEGPSMLPLFAILIILGLGLIASVYMYFTKLDILRKHGPKKRSSHHKIDAVIIGRSEKRIHNSLTNADTILAHYLADLGCKVHHFTEIANAKTFMQRYVPDVVVVDWQLEDNIQSSIESIFLNSKLKLDTVVIFYNVADPTVKPRSSNAGVLMEYLGIAVSDQDLSKIVAPLLKEDRREKRFKESVQTSALEGEIQRGSLSEVLQFIEMGRKNGCLYITENTTPLGLIYFEQGRISYAATPAKQGTDAAFELLDLDKGHFHFVMNKVSEAHTINISTLEIVMEWTRRRDEAGRKG